MVVEEELTRGNFGLFETHEGVLGNSFSCASLWYRRWSLSHERVVVLESAALVYVTTKPIAAGTLKVVTLGVVTTGCPALGFSLYGD